MVRPKKAPGEALSEVFRVRFTAADMEELVRAADAVYMSPTEFARLALMTTARVMLRPIEEAPVVELDAQQVAAMAVEVIRAKAAHQHKVWKWSKGSSGPVGLCECGARQVAGRWAEVH